MGPQKLINKHAKLVLSGLKLEKKCSKVQFSSSAFYLPQKPKNLNFFSNVFDAVIQPNICKRSSMKICCTNFPFLAYCEAYKTGICIQIPI